MKKGFIVLAGALSVAGFAAAYSYSAAQVTNAATLSVVDTQQALFALTPGTGSEVAGTTSVENGNLVFDFNHGSPGNGSSNVQDFGLQQNSVYEWTDLFNIALNTKGVKAAYMAVAGIPSGVHIYVRPSGDAHYTSWQALSSNPTNIHYGNTAYGPQGYDVKITVDPGTSMQANNMQIILSSFAGNNNYNADLVSNPANP